MTFILFVGLGLFFGGLYGAGVGFVLWVLMWVIIYGYHANW